MIRAVSTRRWWNTVIHTQRDRVGAPRVASSATPKRRGQRETGTGYGETDGGKRGREREEKRGWRAAPGRWWGRRGRGNVARGLPSEAGRGNGHHAGRGGGGSLESPTVLLSLHSQSRERSQRGGRARRALEARSLARSSFRASYTARYRADRLAFTLFSSSRAFLYVVT